ncbi:MAG: GGDEF domain-containing protein [Halomonadaceae bacterium]|nr:MAG: GGDEF domain-containing protein [Halomonadaceae bacterium]
MLVLTLVLCSVFAAVNLLRGSFAVAGGLAMLALFSAALFIHLPKSQRIKAWSLCYLILFSLTMMASMLDTSVSNQSFLWLLLIPTMAHFIHGRHQGLVLSLGFLGAARTLYYFTQGVSNNSHSLVDFIHIVSVSLALTGMIYTFEYTREKAEKKLHKLASTDALTGLANRYQLKQALDQTWQQARRFNRRFSVMTLDLDWFKSINDRYGHDAGDQVLRHVAALMRLRLRASDNPSRWGGEEFLVLLPETDRRGAETTAEAFRTTLAGTPMQLHGQPVTVTASIGVAEYPADGDTIEALLIMADRRLYHAKEQGRNRVVTSDNTPLPETPAKTAALTAALD